VRGAVEGLPSPFPLIERMPAVYHDDGVTASLLAALDSVLAPILSTLDCLDAYLDPRLTPEDFLPWLAGWVGLEPDQRWTEDQVRDLMAVTIELYRTRGTTGHEHTPARVGAGIAGLVHAYTGVVPTVTDSGGTTIAARRDAADASVASAFPGSAEPWARVQVALPADSPVTRSQLEALVRPSLPAHVRVVVEVSGGRGEG
jgi:phage tail-like protein